MCQIQDTAHTNSCRTWVSVSAIRAIVQPARVIIAAARGAGPYAVRVADVIRCARAAAAPLITPQGAVTGIFVTELVCTDILCVKSRTQRTEKAPVIGS